MLDYFKRNERAFYWLSISVLVACAIAFKVLYLSTAESTYNAEELPLAAMALVGGSDAITNVAVTRLYGTGYITTALSLDLFGFTVLGIKAPNILFLFLALTFLYLFSRRYLDTGNRWLTLMPVVLLCIGPPVIQIWGMKNRGGFIENIFALTLCLWMLASSKGVNISSIKKLMLGIIVGIATWSQPIGILWGGLLLGYVVLLDLRSSPANAVKNNLTMGFGLVLGLMPLIALNFLYRFNTINVLGGGEMPGGVDLGYLGRLSQLITDGIPRLLGLKEQWSRSWIVPRSMAWFLYGIFLVPAGYATYRAIVDILRGRKLSINFLLVGVVAVILMANIVSSWGNFQLEPRRLLMLYVPFALLTVYGLSRIPRLAVLYLSVWVIFNVWSNYQYISKYRDGFSHPLYKPLDNVAEFLESQGIQGVYTDVWTGSRITFASGGSIPWYRSGYMPTSYGFIGDDNFVGNEAMLFNFDTAVGTSGYQRFINDVRGAGVSCKEMNIQNIRILHDCSSDFHLSELASIRIERPSGGVLIEREVASDDVMVIAGKKVGSRVVANGEPGYLIYGPYTTVPAGKYSVVVKGASSFPFTIDVCGNQGRQIFASSEFENPASLSDGILARMDFSLDQDVSDFEVRVLVPSGSDAFVSEYQIIIR